MKKIWIQLKDYQRKYFDWKLYLSIAVFMTVCIVLNYSYDFEDRYIDAYSGSPLKVLWMFLFHLFPYLSICLILSLFGKVENWWSQSAFWWRVLLGFVILGFDRGFFFIQYLQPHVGPLSFRYVSLILFWASSLISSVLPILLVHHFLETRELPRHYYGLAIRRFDPRPYLLLLGMAAIFLGIGSFMAEIQNYYPRFDKAGIEWFLKENPNWTYQAAVVVYELGYGSDFISVELFFRGFLILSMVRILGPYAVLPMIGTYAFLHFGKPLGETISSMFGGYILGIISMNSRNVWGGVMIHLGVAWLMEILGYLQGRFNS